ncbi:MAG: hypothetical protein BWY60_00263 [Actinobacteria bacterium ADurb.Bin346]|nr:MAG: hypothetical protein BWY60_00263 [Actinobacteria bacterium ADurb.Bin346]
MIIPVDIAAAYKILSRMTLMKNIKELIVLNLLIKEKDEYWANDDLPRRYFE